MTVADAPSSALTSGATFGSLLRAAAAVTVLASFARVLLAPALESSPLDAGAERASAALAYLSYMLLAGALFTGTFLVSRSLRVAVDARLIVVPTAGLVAALAFASGRERLALSWEIALSVAAVVASMRGAVSALFAPVTRAAGGVLALLVIASVVRLAAWRAGMVAGERASTALFAAAERTDGAGLVLEWLAHLGALVWIATRGKKAGLLAAAVVLALSIAITWGGVRELHADSPPWQELLHAAVGHTTGTSGWLAMRVLSALLAVASIGIAATVALLPRQLPAVAAPLALAILSRGAFDAPLRALAAVTAGVWLLLAASEEPRTEVRGSTI